MNRAHLALVSVFFIVAVGIAADRADSAVVIDSVVVGNTGNASGPNGWGAVSYEYRMGTYEVTNAQYTEFLNAVDPTGANALGLFSNAITSSATTGDGIDVNPIKHSAGPANLSV